MKRRLKLIFISCMLLIFAACEKNDPIADLGETNGLHAAQLRVTYNTKKPLAGDTVVITASTWQKTDEISKVQFNETLIQRFGINIKLKNGSSVSTFHETNPTLIIVDTIKLESPWLTINNSSNELNKYFVTSSNDYVIRAEYPFIIEDGKYTEDPSLINQMDENSFNILKSLLAYTINKPDYKLLFPDADETHFTTGGTYVLTQLGINNLKANLTKEALVAITEGLTKSGVYQSIVDVYVVTPTGTTTSTTNTFEISLNEL